MRRSWAAGAVAAALLLTGCGDAEPKLRDELAATIGNVQQESHRFALKLKTGERAFDVTGVVEDDARYSAVVAIDGRPAWEEVASDDTLADRFLDAGALPLFLRSAGTGAKASLPDVRGELAAGRWVIDEVGAPDLLAVRAVAAGSGQGGTPRLLGQDPVLDAVTALDYVRRVLQEQEFRLYNENDLDYDPSEDTFPVPDEDGPIRRYDSVRPKLPTRAQIQGFGGRPVLPDTASFRRMSIYVDDSDRVVRVLEKVDVRSRLKELSANAGVDLPSGVPADRAAAVIVDSLNKVRLGQGDDPIDVHELDLTLTTEGALTVTLPRTGTKGSLGLLVGRGRAAQPAAASDAA